MITTANKGKTLIYICYIRETKPETLLASRARDGFAEVMCARDGIGDVRQRQHRCWAAGVKCCWNGVEGVRTPLVVATLPAYSMDKERDRVGGETGPCPPSKPKAKRALVSLKFTPRF